MTANPVRNVLGTDLEAGLAPPVVLQATHERALDVVTLDQLRSRAYAH